MLANDKLFFEFCIEVLLLASVSAYFVFIYMPMYSQILTHSFNFNHITLDFNASVV